MARHNTIMVSQSLYQIGVFTLIAAMVWVGVGIFTSIGKASVADVDSAVLSPIAPTLDQNVVKALTGRLKVEEDLTPVPSSSASATIETGGTR